MLLRTAVTDDIPAIVALEQTHFARQFVGQWSKERHRATLTGGDAKYVICETVAGQPQAYAILRGLAGDGRAVELKRIVVAVPGQGLGRKILTEIVRMAFEDLRAHRLFLDVFEDNARARHLYESLGFVYEGIMRHAAQRDGAWCNLCLMSMLENEYSAALPTTETAAHTTNRPAG
jgi:RimJ/RimL family protein N-acetyltransferase